MNLLGNLLGDLLGNLLGELTESTPVGAQFMPAPRARELVASGVRGAQFDIAVRAEADGAAVWAVRDARTRKITVDFGRIVLP